MMVKHLLPPRLRDWKKGVPQVGVFLRTAKGDIIESVRDRATDDDVAFVKALLIGVRHLPVKLVREVRVEVENRIKKTKQG